MQRMFIVIGAAVAAAIGAHLATAKPLTASSAGEAGKPQPSPDASSTHPRPPASPAPESTDQAEGTAAGDAAAAETLTVVRGARGRFSKRPPVPQQA